MNSGGGAGDLYETLAMLAVIQCDKLLIQHDKMRRVKPAGQDNEEIVQQIKRREHLSETRQMLSVGKRKKLKR